MKVVILAGGFGTRLSEETNILPKPMVEIGGKPILWHLMKSYSSYGYNEFVILLGYKGHLIKEYFTNYFIYNSDLKINTSLNKIEIINNNNENWQITLIDTGQNTMTGGRIKRVENIINNEKFFLTYGDGLSDINFNNLLNFHNQNNKSLTISAIQPEGKFGALNIDELNNVLSFQEKPKGDGNWVNGGFFVCEPEVFKYIRGDDEIFENYPLETLTNENKVIAFKHKGFWKCMDTLRDKNILNELWANNNAKWKTW
jgi:glucose-1-phosphate cytidylyltransferase